jgi:hypothetical protein
MTYKGVAKGKIIELDEALPYSDGEAVSVSVVKKNGEKVRMRRDGLQASATTRQTESKRTVILCKEILG